MSVQCQTEPNTYRGARDGEAFNDRLLSEEIDA